jgi:hypothetical protein
VKRTRRLHALKVTHEFVKRRNFRTRVPDGRRMSRDKDCQ